MRSRNGFVSNSSSSSFILNFDEEINSKEQLHEKIFQEETVLDSCYTLKQKKYRNLIEQIKSPYVLSVDDCENLYWALTSNDRLLEKIILNVNNNH